MTTIVYRHGEAGRLGFPVRQPTGEFASLTRPLRMVIYHHAQELVIPAFATTGNILGPSGEVYHQSIVAVDITPENLPLQPRLYAAGIQENHATAGGPPNWVTAPTGSFYLEIRRF